MADTSIGTARIDVEVNAETAEATVKRLARGVEDFSKQAQQQYNQLSAAEKRRATSLIKQAETLGMTRAEQIAYNAQLKLSGPLLDEINRKLAQNAARSKVAGSALGGSGKSAKELQFAMRGLPAQFTDIFTSLASGQRPMMVLLQQGGQIKDMFGGIRPAAEALGGAIVRMINPITLAAVAVGGLLHAWNTAEKRAEAFNNALVLTGNYAGTTADKLAELAEQMDEIGGVTGGSASKALAAVAGTGRFTAEQFQLVATAAEQMRVATGTAIDDTISKFVLIAKDPVDALLKLNETEHFLTQTQLDRVRAMKDEGREQEAVTEAVKIYADTVDSRTGEIEANLGLISGAWHGIKSASSDAIDAMVSGLGRADRQAKESFDRLGDFFTRLNQLRSAGPAFPYALRSLFDPIADAKVTGGSQQQAIDSERAAKEIEEQRKTREEATRTWLQLSQQNLDKKQKQLAEEKRITEAGRALGKTEAQINDEIAKSRARFAESNKKREKKESTTDPTASILSRIKQQIALNQQAAEGEGKVTAAQRLRIQVEEELARIGAKATPARRAEIEAGLKQVEVSEAAAEAAKAEARAKEELTRLTNQLTAAEQNRRAQNELDLMAIGRGGEELERAQRRLDIEREYEDGLKQLRDKGVAEDSDSYRQQEQALRESRDRMLAEEEDYFAKRTEMMADWHNGAQKAIDDYLAYVADVAGQTETLVSGVIDELSSGIADIITGTKSVKDALGDVADYLFQQSAKMVADQFLGSMLGKFGLAGENKDSASELNGAAAALASSAAPLSAAAAALGASAAALSAAGLGSAAVGGGSANGYGEMAGNLLDLFSSSGFGFATGGWTGDAPANKVTGVVHGKEFVVNAEATRRLGRGFLERLNLGQDMPTSSGQVLNQTVVMNVQGVMTQQTADQSARELGRETQYRMSRA